MDKPFHSLPMRNLSPAVHFFLTVSDSMSILSTPDFHFPWERNSPQLCLQPWTIRIFHSFRFGKSKLKNKMHPDMGDQDRSSAEPALWKDGFSDFSQKNMTCSHRQNSLQNRVVLIQLPISYQTCLLTCYLYKDWSDKQDWSVRCPIPFHLLQINPKSSFFSPVSRTHRRLQLYCLLKISSHHTTQENARVIMCTLNEHITVKEFLELKECLRVFCTLFYIESHLLGLTASIEECGKTLSSC